MPFKGKLSFKCYNPDKPDKYGIKLYILAESQTGYVSKFEIYSGNGNTTFNIVNSLMAPFKNCGYNLYMDNFYNSVKLSEHLLTESVYTCGTFRLPRGVPKDIQNSLKDLKYNETKFYRKGDIFVISWKDKRNVNLISSLHNADTQEIKSVKKFKSLNKTLYKEVTINKPIAIMDYNKNMKGVDHFDQMLKYYSFARKSTKWTKKMTMYLLQMAIHNSFSLYKQYNTDKKPLKLLQFHEVLYESLMDFNMDDWDHSGLPVIQNEIEEKNEAYQSNNSLVEFSIENINLKPTISKKRIIDPDCRLNKKLVHMLKIYDNKKRCRCRVCQSETKTKWFCNDCKVALCPGICYSKYHSMKNYKKTLKI